MTHITFLPLASPRHPLDGPHPKQRRRTEVPDDAHYAELWEEFLQHIEEAQSGWEDVKWAR
jgi:hypothetical protein